jgi:hypothetical protein
VRTWDVALRCTSYVRTMLFLSIEYNTLSVLRSYYIAFI